MTAEQINKTEKMNGARIFLECLRKEGVDKIFGYPGGSILHIYEELYKCDFIKHYLVRHEQAAVHAAEGYARVTGKPGVVLVTSGPGACNAITGIANAYYDSYPLVVFTGQVDSKLIGNDAFQESDIVGITRTYLIAMPDTGALLRERGAVAVEMMQTYLGISLEESEKKGLERFFYYADEDAYYLVRCPCELYYGGGKDSQ